MTNPKSALADAINSLILDETGAQRRLTSMLAVANSARVAGVSVLMADDTALNPLLQRVFEDPDFLQPALNLINDRRSAAGYLSLVANGAGTPKPRNEYLAEHMRDKRDRERRFVEAWNSMLPDTHRLRGQARADFQRLHANRWYAAKLERKDNLDRQLGRVPTREEVRAMEQQFWSDVEDEIADLEAFAREEMRKGAGGRNPNGFQFRIKPKKEK